MKCREFIPSGMVLRTMLENTRDATWGKLGPNWKGPHRVTFIVEMRAYHLEGLDERPVARPWNVSNLKKYYL